MNATYLLFFIVTKGFCSQTICSKHCPETNISFTIPPLIWGYCGIECVCVCVRVQAAKEFLSPPYCIAYGIPSAWSTLQSYFVRKCSWNEAGIKEIILSSGLHVLKAKKSTSLAAHYNRRRGTTQRSWGVMTCNTRASACIEIYRDCFYISLCNYYKNIISDIIRSI